LVFATAIWAPVCHGVFDASDVVAPDGLAFSPDFTTLYASDTGFFSGTGVWSPLKPHKIYAYDVVQDDDGIY
jgi:sugar lactone lactonase YvrE